MGPDHDVGLAGRHCRTSFGRFFRRHQPRKLAHREGQARETGAEAAEMLPGQERCRRDHGHLLAGHGDHEGGAQGHLCLAEADVAADQPVHGPPGRKIDQDFLDGLGLILGLGIGEPGRELVVEARRRLQGVDALHRTGGGGAHQLLGDVAKPLFDSRLARLPVGAPQPVKLDTRVLRAIARQDLDVLHRYVELVVAFIDELQAIMRRAADIERFQALVAPDPMLGMNDEVTLGKARHLREEAIGLGALAARPDHTVAENVLFGDDREVAGDEALL